MNYLAIKVITKLHQIYHKLFQKGKLTKSNNLPINVTGQKASDEIKRLIQSGEPTMICRFGSTELQTITQHYLSEHNSFIKNCYQFIFKNGPKFWVDNATIETIMVASGFFPKNFNILRDFYLLMLNDIKQINLLGSWRTEETIFKRYFQNSTTIPLADLEPYYHDEPWTSSLRNKKVLIIHPFEESIKNQYEKRKLLFSNQEILPEFELKTLKAIQSITKNETNYSNWFDALNHMKKQINDIDYDIAILGCGAYGLPLAAHIKRQGKQAIQLGGATQILFGIKGVRWDNHPKISKLYNKHWVRPLSSETPKNHSNVEEGCYW